MGFEELINVSKDYLLLTYQNLSVLLIVYLIILTIVICVVVVLNRPVNIIRDFSKTEANLFRFNKPKSFPNGWIGVCESRYLRENEIKRVDFCGNRIILFRSSTSPKRPYVLDAFCPHLGADFSVGGKIVKKYGSECIRCPFHGWVFRANDGLCLEVPYTKDKKPPNGVKAKVWKCLEMNGFIYIWHHSEGKDPTWTPPIIDQISTKKWKYFGRTEHLLNCLLHEIPENGPDFSHLNEIHAPSFLWGGKIRATTNALIDAFSHNWETTWQKSDETHKAKLTLTTKTFFLGFKLLEINFDEIEQIGPAIVNLLFCFNLLGIQFRGCFIQSVISLAINKQKIIHHLYMEPRWISPILAKFFLKVEAIMLERDIQIWSNKKYLENPNLVKEEKQILTFRRWYSQFFSDPKEPETKFEDLW